MKFLVTLLIALVTFATADAAKVDIYKTAIQNKTFTLKYKVNEFPVHNINKNAMFKSNFWGKDRIVISNNTQQDKDTGGVIVFNKDDKYFERPFKLSVTNNSTILDSAIRKNFLQIIILGILNFIKRCNQFYRLNKL